MLKVIVSFTFWLNICIIRLVDKGTMIQMAKRNKKIQRNKRKYCNINNHFETKKWKTRKGNKNELNRNKNKNRKL